MERVLPILFNTDMVRAILEDRKTATRRVVKKEKYLGVLQSPSKGIHPEIPDRYYIKRLVNPPYEKGDIMYVRETYRPLSDHPYAGFDYAADWSPKYFENSKDKNACNNGKWKPSIHMPKRAARIWLKVTDVRVERLRDMRLDDFLSEGVCIRPEAFNDPDNACMQARDNFVAVWNDTVPAGQQDLYGWEANPWVWVIEFEQCEKPE